MCAMMPDMADIRHPLCYVMGKPVSWDGWQGWVGGKLGDDCKRKEKKKAKKKEQKNTLTTWPASLALPSLT